MRDAFLSTLLGKGPSRKPGMSLCRSSQWHTAAERVGGIGFVDMLVIGILRIFVVLHPETVRPRYVGWVSCHLTGSLLHVLRYSCPKKASMDVSA